MTRIARVVVPDCPHHVTQRGNRRQKTFFEDDDYVRYKELLAQGCKQASVEVWEIKGTLYLIDIPAPVGQTRACLGSLALLFPIARTMSRSVATGNNNADERTGRPLASSSFLKQIEKRLGRKLTKQKPGPKPKHEGCVG
ncbi:MAG: hypothetical protein SGJ03_17645 [Alphaproteobacteria bacterium]|nr:hypothetical protein [Alphaproteobacteria bacterium]